MPFDPPHPPEQPYALVFDAEPDDGVAGEALGVIRVAVVGKSGRTVKTATTMVTLNPENWCFGNVLGTKSVAAVEGVATFNDIRFDRACSIWYQPKQPPLGGYRLFAYASGLQPDTSRRFEIAPAPPSLLDINFSELTANAGQPVLGVWYYQNQRHYALLQLSVTDALGNWVDWAGTVTVTLGANPAGAVLSGTTRITAHEGSADVDSLVIDKPGSGYTLVFSAPGLTTVVTQPFTVAAASP